MSIIPDPEDSEYHFVRQVDSEENVGQNLKEQLANKEPPPPAPLLKKSITAGEAISKLNNILDVQARLQAFELPHDGPRRKFPRTEPISGSVRLAQLVSLERELKEAIYFRSLESRWTPITLREKLIRNVELTKLTEEFHKKLAEEAPSRFLGSISEKLSTAHARGPKGEKSNGSPQSHWPWPFPGKPGRKMWEPLPDTYLKPWEPWTKLREKPSLSFPRRQPGQQPAVESSSRLSLLPKSKKRQKKPWDPATHRQRRGIFTPVTPNTPRPVKTTTFRDSETRLNFGGFGSRGAGVSPLRGSTFIKVYPQTNASTNFKVTRPKGRSGYFRMPPLKEAVAIIEVDSDDDVDLETRPSMEMSTIFDDQQNSKGIKSEAAAAILGTTTSVTDVPMVYPKPWQFFKYRNFGETWDPVLYKSTGSAWDEITSGNPPVQQAFRMDMMSGTADSMNLSKNRSQCLMSNLSTEVGFSSAVVEIKSQLENYFDEKERRMARKYSVFSSNPAPDTREADTPRPRSPLSTIHSRVTRKLAQAHVKPLPNEYVDRGLEGALVEVQKAIKTAIPTFRLDKAHKQLSASEVQTDEWMKKFIDQMTHTAPHKPRPPRLPLEERRSTPKQVKPRSPLHFYKAPQPVPNTGDELIVFVVNGKPQIPEYTVGTPLNSYLFPPKSLEFLPHVCQRLTRCTVCRPYSFDGRQDPVANLRKFCRNIPLPGFRNDQIFFKMDVVNNKLIVNGLRHAKGDECYRNVTHALTIPDGMTLLDLEVYRSDKGTLFFHDAREEARIQRRLQREHDQMHPNSKKHRTKNEVEIKTIFKDNDYGYKTPGYFYRDDD